MTSWPMQDMPPPVTAAPPPPPPPDNPAEILKDLGRRLGILMDLNDQVEGAVAAARLQHDRMAARIAALEAKLGGK